MKRFVLLLIASSVAVWSAQPLAQGASSSKPAAATPAKKSATSTASQAKPASTAAARTITITASDTPMAKWDTTKITAKPGEELHIVLKATGTMPKAAMAHNFVLFKAGTTEAQINDFVSQGAMAAATNYIPAAKASMVLAHTPKLVGAGETSEVTFKAPMTPGSYPYICSFPGHYAMGMKGTLVVAK
jgi:azurin